MIKVYLKGGSIVEFPRAMHWEITLSGDLVVKEKLRTHWRKLVRARWKRKVWVGVERREG